MNLNDDEMDLLMEHGIAVKAVDGCVKLEFDISKKFERWSKIQLLISDEVRALNADDALKFAKRKISVANDAIKSYKRSAKRAAATNDGKVDYCSKTNFSNSNLKND